MSDMASSYPEAGLDEDRQMLTDFIHHPRERCDAAAKRLSQSHRHEDRMIGTEWLKLRTGEGQK